MVATVTWNIVPWLQEVVIDQMARLLLDLLRLSPVHHRPDSRYSTQLATFRGTSPCEPTVASQSSGGTHPSGVLLSKLAKLYFISWAASKLLYSF